MKLIQLNVRANQEVVREVTQYAESNEVNIMCLQDLPPPEKFEITTIKCKVFQSKNKSVATVVFGDQNQTYINPEHTKGDILDKILMDGKERIFITNVYLRPWIKGNNTFDKLVNRLKCPPKQLVVCGDMNSRNIEWDTRNNTAGKELLRITQEAKLKLLNEKNVVKYKNFTLNGMRKSVIDLCFVSEKMLLKKLAHKVMQDVKWPTDHLPVMF